MNFWAVIYEFHFVYNRIAKRSLYVAESPVDEGVLQPA
jgi:hypothetical protein